jgi:hypothetical protein
MSARVVKFLTVCQGLPVKARCAIVNSLAEATVEILRLKTA